MDYMVAEFTTLFASNFFQSIANFITTQVCATRLLWDFLGSADVDVADIWTMDGMEDYYMVEENLWGAERGAILFHLVSLSFSNSGVVVWCLLGCVLGFVFLVVFCSLPGKLLHPISFQFQTNFPVVDGPCLVLRQCRKKKLWDFPWPLIHFHGARQQEGLPYSRPPPLRHNVPHRLLSAHSDC